jgi:hypothetical protein
MGGTYARSEEKDTNGQAEGITKTAKETAGLHDGRRHANRSREGELNEYGRICSLKIFWIPDMVG